MPPQSSCFHYLSFNFYLPDQREMSFWYSLWLLLLYLSSCSCLWGRQSQLTLPRPNYLLLTFPISTLICAALLPSLICGLFCPTSALSAAHPRPGKQDHHHFNNLLGSRQNPPLHCKIAFGPTPCSHIFR